MKRSIRFSKFRNIGLENPEYLTLNSNFIKGQMGNLIIVIGSNNSGKSNVLDGIKKITAEKLTSKDITTLSFDDNDRIPSVALCYTTDDFKAEYEVDLTSRGKWNVKDAGTHLKTIDLDKTTLLSDLSKVREIFYSYDLNDAYLALEIDSLNQKIKDEDDVKYSYSTYREQVFTLLSKCSEVKKIIHNNARIDAGSATQTKVRIWNAISTSELKIYDDWLESCKSFGEDHVKMRLNEGINPVPAVYEYNEAPLKNADLYVDNVNNIPASRFFSALFMIMDVDVKLIINAYRQFNTTNNKAILNKLKKDLDIKIQPINDLFNKMYFASNDQYKFTLDFDSARISFGMARGKAEDAIDLESQSTGFKWFFNLFFNFLSANRLEPGDIVIMDEPATNLHPQGQMELRKFIKDYAIKNDITVIIATHSPFMIDPDNYDELRVVKLENNRCSIDNMFTAINTGDPDTLLPIKESLTIKQNILYDLDTEIVWVEGITDYIYLTMFKKLLDIQNIAFLPFNGVGTSKTEAQAILLKLLGVKFHRRSLLVDGDKAGIEMFQLAKDTAFDSVHNISEVQTTTESGKAAKTIEDLFSKEDKQKYPVISEKKGLGASEMKIHAKLSDFSEATVNNFKKLFELLQE